MSTLVPSKLVDIDNFFDNVLGERFQCFGCSKHNENSLQGKFYHPEEDDGKVYGIFPPVGISKTSFPNVVHGGVISSIIDDTAYWTFFHKFRMLAVTKEMNVKYLSPCSSTCSIVAIGSTDCTEKPKPGDQVEINVIVINRETEKPVTKGSVTFFVLPEEKLTHIMGNTASELLNKL